MNEQRLQLANDALAQGHITSDELAKISLQEGAISQEEYNKVTAPGWKNLLSKIGGPAIETGGLIGGEVGGAALGAMTTPITGPFGVVGGRTAGGAVGEAAGELGRKELDTALGFRKQPNLKEMGQTLAGGAKRGALYSAGGQALGGAFKLAKPYLAPLGRGLAKMGEAATGTAGRVFEQVAENPKMILPEALGGAQKLGESEIVDKATKQVLRPGTGAKGAYGTARRGFMSGKELGVAEGEVGGIYEDTLTKSKAVINDIDKALKRGEKITAKEAVPAYEWVNSRMKQITPAEGIGKLTADAKNEYFSLKGLKDSLKEEIKREAPEFWNKVVNYAKATTKDQATKILPQGYGARYLARRSIPIMAGFMNPLTGLAIGAGMSPSVWSGAAAAGASGYATTPIVKALMKLRKNDEDLNP